MGDGHAAGLARLFFYFLSVLRGRARRGRSGMEAERFRSSGASPATAHQIIQFNRLFFAGTQGSGRNRQMILHHRAARPAPTRPHQKFAFSQGIPGIFSHFLRNYR
ncbi:hypothetical protein KDX32_03195 [Burkholderia ambifaria]|jgi:hypothetical protein|uniref:hypothetical protein n=1 Tax=Burkholderia ambifaria TaxID=152480 RepID=UPI00158992FD|nr:hypothetical protein [Burkholderia ambifaria]MBR8062093.1 hypothetical protein [Burkholderia ambifaria]MBR8175277.1 hypothetical protein [Burkholderia ambifaria]